MPFLPQPSPLIWDQHQETLECAPDGWVCIHVVLVYISTFCLNLTNSNSMLDLELLFMDLKLICICSFARLLLWPMVVNCLWWCDGITYELLINCLINPFMPKSKILKVF